MYKNRPNTVLALEIRIRVNFGQGGGWKLGRGMQGEHLRYGKVLFLHLDGKYLGEPNFAIVHGGMHLCCVNFLYICIAVH